MNKIKPISSKTEKSNSLMKNIEKAYGKDFSTVKDMDINAYLKKAGYPSLGKLLKNA